MFVPRHRSQGHPKSNFTWLEWTDEQHSWSSWRSGGKTQTKHWKTLGKCPLIPFFSPLCVRREGKKKKSTFILSRISKIQIILLFKISTWMWPGAGPGKAYPCGNGGMGWNGTALPPSALHMDLFLFLYPTIGWGHKRIPGIKPFLRAQPKLPFSAEKKKGENSKKNAWKTKQQLPFATAARLPGAAAAPRHGGWENP